MTSAQRELKLYHWNTSSVASVVLIPVAQWPRSLPHSLSKAVSSEVLGPELDSLLVYC